MGGEWELIIIAGDSFKIMAGSDRSLFNLDKGDDILAEGKVEYISDEFIKLTSTDDAQIVRNNISFVESYEKDKSDSLHIQFIFPFNGDFSIYIKMGDNIHSVRYTFKNKKEIILPVHPDSVGPFSFDILNQTPPRGGYPNYLKRIVFYSFSFYELKNQDTNCLTIHIPYLTNSYFARYLINGEYVRFMPGGDFEFLVWRNMRYYKMYRYD
jgi:hypothetical protein